VILSLAPLPAVVSVASKYQRFYSPPQKENQRAKQTQFTNALYIYITPASEFCATEIQDHISCKPFPQKRIKTQHKTVYITNGTVHIDQFERYHLIPAKGQLQSKRNDNGKPSI